MIQRHQISQLNLVLPTVWATYANLLSNGIMVSKHFLSSFTNEMDLYYNKYLFFVKEKGSSYWASLKNFVNNHPLCYAFYPLKGLFYHHYLDEDNLHLNNFQCFEALWPLFLYFYFSSSLSLLVDNWRIASKIAMSNIILGS